MMFDPPGTMLHGELANAVRKVRSGIASVIMLSILLNVLLLGGAIYMMLVYDQTLPSRSLPTLFGLLAMVCLVYVFQGLFDVLRGRILADMAASIHLEIAPRVQQAITHLSIGGHDDATTMTPARDIDQIRTFLASPGPVALIDLPWILFFLGIITMLHLWLGVTVLVGAIIMLGLTWLNARLGAGGTRMIAGLSTQRMGEIEASRRHAETVRSLGMEQRINDRWVAVDTRYIAAQRHYSALAGILSSASRVFRQFLQSAVLTVGALLVINGEATGGIIFASSILSSRALAPVDQAIANWRGFGAARDAWKRLNGLLGALPVRAKATSLPAPHAELLCEAVHVGPPALSTPTVRDISFRLTAGDGLGIIGPSGSGKSTLARAIAGIWTPQDGKIRLDGASIDQWNPEELGRHIGYMPQDVQLLDGTIAQNIARFDPLASDEDIVAAARSAGAHEMILRLPQGYDTPLGMNGHALSGGQRQRISLARALFGDPFLLILDEPNAHLDNDGESALIHAIRMARARGAIVVVVAHRPVVMNALGHALHIEGGMMADFGTRNDVLSRTLFANRQPAAPVRVAASA